MVTCRKTRKSDLTDVRNDGPLFCGKSAGCGGNSDLLTCRKTGPSREKSDMRMCGEKAVQKAEIRLGDVRKPDGTAEDGQVSHEFLAGTVQTGQTLSWVVFPILYHKILRCPRKMTGFQHLWNCPGTLRKCRARVESARNKSEVGEAVHEKKSDLTAARREGLHESKSEVREPRCTKRSRNLRRETGGLARVRKQVGSRNWGRKRCTNGSRNSDGGETAWSARKQVGKSRKRCTKRSRNRWSGSPRDCWRGPAPCRRCEIGVFYEHPEPFCFGTTTVRAHLLYSQSRPAHRHPAQ